MLKDQIVSSLLLLLYFVLGNFIVVTWILGHNHCIVVERYVLNLITGSVGCQCPINSKIVVFVDVILTFTIDTCRSIFSLDPGIAGLCYQPQGPPGGCGSDVSILKLTNFFSGGYLKVAC